MCLNVDTRITGEVLARGDLKAWKVMYRERDVLWSWYQGFSYVPGRNVAYTSPSLREDLVLGIVAGGAIHVLLNQEEAKRLVEEMVEDRRSGALDVVVVGVDCKVERLVAAGHWNHMASVCYTEVWLDEDEYLRAMGKEVESGADQVDDQG